jgi:plastocyanin
MSKTSFGVNLVAILVLGISASFGGEIKGTVKAQGKEGATSATVGPGLYESRKFKFVEKVDYGHLRDFVVYIDQTMGTPIPPTNAVPVVTQKDATFRPHVLPIVVGTTVSWPNQDEIFHNVFSYSEVKQFDLGLYKNEVAPKVVKFDKPGRVDALCSIHTQMHCIILVLENSYFALTDSKGEYSITNVPAGTWRLKAWHERMPAEVKEITVSSNGVAKADFTLGIKGLPQY